MRRIVIAAALAASLAACGAPKNSIGLIDEERIKANWPKFLNYQNQLSYDAQVIERSRDSARRKAQERLQLQQRFVREQNELTGDVTDAARQVAADKHLTYVFTRQFVGYGGVDITPEIEKILQIVEKASPTP
jgi:Skp family chaperone for outer membrane proteins